MLMPRRSRAGWIACVPQGSAVHLAVVEPGEKPRVRWVNSLAQATSRAALLHRARRSLPRGQWPSVALLERGQYQLVQTEAPEVPPQEWRDALRWRLKDQVEFPVDGAAVDLLPMPPQAGARNQRSLIAAIAAGTALQSLRGASEDAGWAWQAVDVGETALRNLSALLATPGRGHALLHVGESHATLVITVAGALLLSRQIEVTRQQIGGDPKVDDPNRNAALERAGLELQRTLDGFDRVFSQVGLERVEVLPGPGAEPLADFVRELVYVPVKVADLSSKLDWSDLPADADLSDHWLAIGAALRQSGAAEAETGAQPEAEAAQPTTEDVAAAAPKAPVAVDLNFDPPTARSRKQPWRAGQCLSAAAAGLALAWLSATGLDAWAQQREQAASAMALDLPRQRAELEAQDPGGADAIQRLAGERQRLQTFEAELRVLRTQVDEHLKRGSSGYTPFFKALSRQSQPAVWITGFSVTPSGQSVEIKGGMSDAASLPVYLQRLNQEAAFKGRQFAKLQLGEGEGFTEFTLSGNTADGGGAPK